ncbi:MAG: hypothetical protein NVS1B4_21840 [Gemmatimonadaceae bacterium]
MARNRIRTALPQAVTLTALMTLAACSHLANHSTAAETGDTRPATAPSVAVERAVYAALLDSMYVSPRTRRVAVAEASADLAKSSSTLSAWLRHPSSLRSETFRNFRERNTDRWTLAAKPRLRVPVDLLGQPEERRLATGGTPAWRDFARRYPEGPGLIRLSRAGFNADTTQAFVAVDRSCGAGCGELSAYLLTRGSAGRWQVAEQHVIGRTRLSAEGDVVGRPRSPVRKRRGPPPRPR